MQDSPSPTSSPSHHLPSTPASPSFSRPRPTSTPLTAALSAPYTHALIEHSVLHSLVQSHCAHLLTHSQMPTSPSTPSSLLATLDALLLDIHDSRTTLHHLTHTLPSSLSHIPALPPSQP